MTQITIAKFGGSSVADVQAMNNCATIIQSDPSIRLVVLSASAGITNALVALSTGCSADKRTPYLQEIRHIQSKIMDALSPSAAVRKIIEQILDKITTLAEVAYLTPSPALTDELISQGELMSSRLFTELLRQRGIAATWFDVRSVMRTNDHFGKAEPELTTVQALCQQHLSPLLAEQVVITQGFIGSDNKGRTTTLGRGGSDYSAALLSEALCAQRIDIWTDVPGIYTTDPRLVPAAKRIEHISFSEAAEMATFGAKILHPATLLPAVRSDIPVFIGSSKQPTDGGTLIRQTAEHPPRFRALALRRQQTLVNLHSLNMLHSCGFLADVFSILARHAVSVDLVTTSEVNIALTLDTTGAASGQQLLSTELLAELSTLCRVEVEQDLALITLIGNHLSQASGIADQLFSVLTAFNIRLICYGASNHNLCFLVNNQDAEQIIQILHQQLFS